MAKKKTTSAKTKPQGLPVPDMGNGPASAKKYPEWKHLLKENQPEVLPPESSVESCMDPDRAKFVTVAMQGAAARRGAFDFSQIQADISQLMNIAAPVLRSVLLKHLEMAALVSIKQTNDILSMISAADTSEVAREILIRRLGAYAHFTEAVNRQRILIQKAGFMKEQDPTEELKDPADLSEEEWVAKYQPRLTTGKPDVQ